MIDEDFRVWLIEVNEYPYLGCPNEYIAKLVPQMLDDLVSLITQKTLKNDNFELIHSNQINLR